MPLALNTTEDIKIIVFPPTLPYQFGVRYNRSRQVLFLLSNKIIVKDAAWESNKIKLLGCIW